MVGSSSAVTFTEVPYWTLIFSRRLIVFRCLFNCRLTVNCTFGNITQGSNGGICTVFVPNMISGRTILLSGIANHLLYCRFNVGSGTGFSNLLISI